MVNIFKTTLKKDIITEIADNNKREVRFPITKFWATRFAGEYNLDEKTFVFKTFDSVEFSTPSNKDTGATTYTFDFVRTFVDGDEFVIEFKDSGDPDADGVSNVDTIDNDADEVDTVEENINDEVVEKVAEDDVVNTDVDNDTDDNDSLETYTNDIDTECDTEIVNASNEDILDTIKQMFDDEMILDSLYESESVIATNARQVIILPKGRILGVKKSLPLNNDVELRVEFDKQIKVYFPTCDKLEILDIFELFRNDIYTNLAEIRRNNFIFVWKRYTGIFKDSDGRVYFGMKYTTKKSIGFDRRYNVQ